MSQSRKMVAKQRTAARRMSRELNSLPSSRSTFMMIASLGTACPCMVYARVCVCESVCACVYFVCLFVCILSYLKLEVFLDTEGKINGAKLLLHTPLHL